jgi:hypothetical protein
MALLAVALAGCYQQPASPVTAAAPVNSRTGSAASATDATSATPAAIEVPEGMQAVVLAVPGMH